MLRYFSGSIVITLVGLVLGAFLGWETSGTWSGVASTVFIVAVLGVLEISLSFDNAVVNATVLRDMEPIWRQRFLTWGIAAAVFGMRVVFPLAIVAVIGRISPLEAVRLAASEPARYAEILQSAHVGVSAFGGAFLAMVGLRHFFDREKEVHWIEFIEAQLVRLGHIEAVELGLVMVLLYVISTRGHPEEQVSFLVAGMFGLITYIAVDGLGAIIEGVREEGPTLSAARNGLSAFIYLEVLDASFSFDGVIGAFALSTNLLVIAIGLGIGAMFVRSFTIMLVDRGTLTEYRYLEHGAFYAVTALGAIMFVQAVVPIPEVFTGLIGAAFIGLAVLSSIRYNRLHPEESADDAKV